MSNIKRKIVNRIYSPKHEYFRRYYKYSFRGIDCKNYEQYEAVITRLYHTVEKGLSFLDYRAGFGKENIIMLIKAMNDYSSQYDIEAEFYKTALSTLMEYVKKNKEHDFSDPEIENMIKSLKGSPNSNGGALSFTPRSTEDIQKLGFEQLLRERHSIRHFGKNPVDIDKVVKAVELAQFTPSACNRQGWKTWIIKDKDLIRSVLDNQNGNRGFGDEINVLLLITSDLNYFSRDREVFQAYIDGGMYAENVINALFYYNIATIPLSASLSASQEKEVRRILGIEDNEVFIIFIGAGNYPDECVTTKSTRRAPKIVIK